MKPYIDKTQDFALEMLETIRYSESPSTEDKCPHCGEIVRYPLVVRECDLKDFAMLIRITNSVLNRHNITAHILSEIQAGIAIAIAMK